MTTFQAFTPFDGAATAVHGSLGVAEAPLQMHGRDHMRWGDGSGIAMLIIMGVFWLSLVALAAWAIASFSHRHHEAAPPTVAPSGAALEIARQRYARGEISAEEFETIRRNLG
jgi:putative membrane protein